MTTTAKTPQIPANRRSARLALRNVMEQRISSMKPGAALPPLRELMQEYSVGSSKLNTILAQLEHDGIVLRKPRSGIYKAPDDSGAASIPFIDVILCNMITETHPLTEGMGQYTTHLISELSTSISRFNRGCRIHKTRKDASLSEYMELFSKSDLRAAILVYQTLPDLADLLDQKGVAWVSLMPKFMNSGRRSIMDSPKRTELQLDYLIKLGHKRIAYLDVVDTRAYSISALMWRESFSRIMANHHLEVKEHWIQTPGFEDKGIRSALEAVFSEKPYPTAVIVRDYDLPIAYGLMDEMGLKVGKDISFIADSDQDFVRKLNPPATSVVNSAAIAAEMAIESLRVVMSGQEPPPNQHIPLSLVERKSTAPATGL